MTMMISTCNPKTLMVNMGRTNAYLSISGRNLRAAKHRFESIQKPTGRIVAGPKTIVSYQNARCDDKKDIVHLFSRLRFSILSKCY